MYKVLLVVFFLFGISTHAAAQRGRKLDSLLVVNERYVKEDTTKIRTLLRIGILYQEINFDESLKFIDKAVVIAQKLNDNRWLGEAFIEKANVHDLKREDPKTMQLYKQALNYFELANNKKGIASAHNNIAGVHARKKELPLALESYERAMVLYRELGQKLNEAIVTENIGSTNYSLTNYDKALEYFGRANNLYEKLGNQAGIARVYNYSGSVYYRLANYNKALENYLKALRINETLGYKSRNVLLYNQIGVIYSTINDREKDLEFYNKSLSAAESLGDKFRMAEAMINIGKSYKNQKNTPKAAGYFERAMALAEQIGSKEIKADCLNTLGTLYFDQKQYDKSLSAFQQSLQMSQEVKNKNLTIESLHQIGRFYYYVPDSVLLKNGISPAQRYAKSYEMNLQSLNLAREIGNKPLIAERLKNLSVIQEKQGDFVKAFKNYKSYIALKDRILSEDVRTQITRKGMQYEFDKKESDLKFQQQLTAAELEKQKLLTTQREQELMLNAQQLRLKSQELDLSIKEKELQQLAFLQMKAEKQEQENLIVLAEKDKQLQASQLGILIKEKALQVQTLARKNALIAFLAASLIGLLLAAFAYYLWQKQKQLKQDKSNNMNFTKQLLENTEEERKRIASDLHDSISHELLSLKSMFQLDSANLMTKVDSIINDVRAISRNLHPVMFDKIGLTPNIEQLVERFQTQNDFLITTEINYSGRLSSADELQIYRIVQESLSNIIKYADAHAAKITILEHSEKLTIEIRDNGKGFNVKETLNGGRSFGLHNIIERARVIGGLANIESSAGGTVVTVEINQ